MTAAQRWTIWIGLGILSLYVLALVFPYPFLLAGNFKGDEPQGRFFLELLATRDNPLSFAIGLVTPALSVVSVAALWSERNGIWAKAALALASFGVLASWGLWFWLGQIGVAENLWQPEPLPGLDNPERFASALHEFLGGAWKALATLAGVLLGIQFVKDK